MKVIYPTCNFVCIHVSVSERKYVERRGARDAVWSINGLKEIQLDWRLPTHETIN
jgi:hypothetical protein